MFNFYLILFNNYDFTLNFILLKKGDLILHCILIHYKLNYKCEQLIFIGQIRIYKNKN